MLSQLPDLYYNTSKSPLDQKLLLAKNLWRRGEILKEYKSSLTLFNEYLIQNGEKPEDIALEKYDNPFYNWTILIINDITNYHEQWPRSTMQLQEYVNAKYDNPEATKQHITTEVKDASNNIIVPAGKVVPSTFQIAYWNGSVTVTANPVYPQTYYQYEEELNAKKEKIQIVQPRYIEDFVENYYKIITRGASTSLGFDASAISMA
tara:strand:+ start:4459 stop:5076 length:618 start_codon:yes stop_codon:yes gene_type:complete